MVRQFGGLFWTDAFTRVQGVGLTVKHAGDFFQRLRDNP
jgi:hypothetical protein